MAEENDTSQERFSPIVEKQLKLGGWKAGRNIPVERQVVGYNNTIVYLHDAATQILEEFTGLEFKPDRSIRTGHGENITVELNTDWHALEFARVLKERTSKTWICIGFLAQGDFVFVDSLERIVVRFHTFTYYTSCFDRFLGQILSGLPPENPPPELDDDRLNDSD